MISHRTRDLEGELGVAVFGKETSGQFVWMDLVEKRAGKWVVVRSLGSKMK